MEQASPPRSILGPFPHAPHKSTSPLTTPTSTSMLIPETLSLFLVELHGLVFSCAFPLPTQLVQNNSSAVLSISRSVSPPGPSTWGHLFYKVETSSSELPRSGSWHLPLPHSVPRSLNICLTAVVCKPGCKTESSGKI